MVYHQGAAAAGLILNSPEPRVTPARAVSSLKEHSPAASEHSRQSLGLVTGTTDSPSTARNEPRPGSFQMIRSKRKQGKRQEWRQGCNLSAKSTQETKPGTRCNIGPRDSSRR